MLCGQTPFDGATALDVMQNVISKRIVPVSSRRLDIPEALSEVIQRMTQRNIEDRYHSTSGLKVRTPMYELHVRHTLTSYTNILG
jgi:hypothetical protein